jgi:hypothetical protein
MCAAIENIYTDRTFQVREDRTLSEKNPNGQESAKDVLYPLSSLGF